MLRKQGPDVCLTKDVVQVVAGGPPGLGRLAAGLHLIKLGGGEGQGVAVYGWELR